MNKKYCFIGFITLAVIIVGYHFFAAAQAEQQIDSVIQEEAQKIEALSVQYSDIEVAPFGASVTVRDLTIIFNNHIERAQKLRLAVSYGDILNSYVGGLKYGLNNLGKAHITAVRPSYVNKKGLKEFKSDSLQIYYTGNALNGLRSAINGTPFSSSQNFETRSSNITIALPQTNIGTIKAKQLHLNSRVAKNDKSFWLNGQHQLQLDSLTWSPPKQFQNTYSFFIKGFGYTPDAIPFRSAELSSKGTTRPNQIALTASLSSELALFSASGNLQLQTPLKQSQFRETELAVTNLSDSFSRLLNNLEKLLSISMPRQNGAIRLTLEGPVTNPSIAK